MNRQIAYTLVATSLFVCVGLQAQTQIKEEAAAIAASKQQAIQAERERMLIQRAIVDARAESKILHEQLAEISQKNGFLDLASLDVRQQLIGKALTTLFEAKVEAQVNQAMIDRLKKDIEETTSPSIKLKKQRLRVERDVIMSELQVAKQHMDDVSDLAAAGKVPRSETAAIKSQVEKLSLKLVQLEIEEKLVDHEANESLATELAERTRENVAIKIKAEFATRQLAELSASLPNARKAALLERQIERQHIIVDRLRDRLLEAELESRRSHN